MQNIFYSIRLEAFTVTELDKIFSGNKPYRILPLMMEAEVASKMLEFCPQLTQLVALEYLFKLYFIPGQS
jgi:hypothetical protein